LLLAESSRDRDELLHKMCNQRKYQHDMIDSPSISSAIYPQMLKNQLLFFKTSEKP
jgi:hypothetical protein